VFEFPEDEAIKNFKEGLKFARSNQRDQAIHFFKKAVEIDPDLIEGWNNLGLLYLQANQLEKGIESLDNALGIRF
jgi:tetratricopeptide (TPR) repeat protein